MDLLKCCTIALLAGILSALDAHCETPAVWSRGVTADTSTTADYEFSLYAVSHDRDQFAGTWLYMKYQLVSSKGSSSPFVAFRDKNGVLWPKVALAIRRPNS